MREWGEGHLRESSPPRLPMRRAPMEEMQSTHVSEAEERKAPQLLALQIRFGGSCHPSFHAPADRHNARMYGWER